MRVFLAVNRYETATSRLATKTAYLVGRRADLCSVNLLDMTWSDAKLQRRSPCAHSLGGINLERRLGCESREGREWESVSVRAQTGFAAEGRRLGVCKTTDSQHSAQLDGLDDGDRAVRLGGLGCGGVLEREEARRADS